MAEKESTSETVFQVNFFISRYHEYQEIWTLEIGDEYELKRELLNTVDHNAVAIVRKREGDRSKRKCIHENELNKAKQFLDMFPSSCPYGLQNFSRGQQTKEEL